jgi:hypothetical protein
VGERQNVRGEGGVEVLEVLSGMGLEGFTPTNFWEFFCRGAGGEGGVRVCDCVA